LLDSLLQETAPKMPHLMPCTLLLVLFAGLAQSGPLPQLTIAEFQSRGRSLADPSPLVSEPYASIRRQGRKGSSEIIKFPTLEVRNPNELLFASPVQKTAFAAGPVYKSNNELSTQDIEEKITQINTAEIIGREEQILGSMLTKEMMEEVEELTDIAAAEIAAEEIAEEIDELTDILATEIAAEEVAEEINELTDIIGVEIAVEEVAEEINEITDIEAAEIVAEEVADEVVGEMIELEIGSLNGSEQEETESENEGSGNIPTIDFGDITEVLLLS